MPADTLINVAGVLEPTPDAALAGGRPKRSSLARLNGWLEARAMFVIAVSAVLVLSLLGIPKHFSQDGWLALVAGRSVAAHGVPQHDYFTHMSYGVRWVDQQWLAQLLMYEVQRLGGLQLLTVLYVLVTGFAFGAAIMAARDLFAEDLHILMAAIPGAFFYLVTAVSIRTQGLAYPMFVATLWLLASETRSQRRRARVYVVFPLLVLWANVHGSATLGAGLAVLFGLSQLLAGLRRSGVRGLADIRALAFVVISPLTLLATPYGFGMVHYYRVTLLNSQFSRIVTEWKPVTSIPILAAPLFVLIALTAVATVRAYRRAHPTDSFAGETHRQAQPPLFDLLTLGVLAVGAVMAVRNVTWFGLALMVLLPPIITQMRAGQPAPLRRARVNRRLATGMVVLALVVAAVVLTRPSSWFTSTYPTRAVATLRALVAREPRATILADVRYADWLIWEDPRVFSGRVAYDTSFELLTKSQLDAIADLAANTRNARGVINAYPIWMLDPANRALNRMLLRRPHVRVVRRGHAVIIARNGTAART